MELRKGDTSLVLHTDTKAAIAYKNTVLSAEFGDDFSLPFTAPIRGNEEALGYTYHLAVKASVKLEGWELWHAGTRLHPGVLYIDQIIDDSVELSFTADGFLNRFNERLLAELDLGPLVDVPDMADHAKDVNTLAWPAAAYCFPMHFNPSFYGTDANPDWFPDRSEWDVGGSYSVNDLVSYPQFGLIRRTWDWQCTAPPFTSPPYDGSPVWRRVAFGLVNHWDHVAEEFKRNDADGNFFNLVPWFYLKELIKRAAAAFGHTVSGDFMLDARYDRQVVYNNFALDGGKRTFYFRTEQLGTLITPHYIGTTIVRQPAHDDSTTPNVDVDDVWDTTDMVFTVPEAGTYRFKAYRRVRHASSQSGSIYMQYVDTDELIDGPHPFLLSTVINYISPEWDEIYFEGSQTFVTGDIGREVYFVLAYPGAPTRTYEGCWIQGWKVDPALINGYAKTIEPKNHVPPVSFAELLLSLRDEHRLRIWMTDGVLRLDYSTTEGGDDITGMVRSPVRRVLSERSSGLTVGYDVDTGDNPDLTKYLDRGRFATEALLPFPYGPGEFAVVLSTRQVYVSVQVTYSPYFVWEPRGWYLPARTFGEKADAEEVSVAFGPLFSDRVDVLGEQFIVPVIDEPGQGSYFRSSANPPSLRMCFYHGMQPNDNDVLYPMASSFGLLDDGDTVHNAEIDFNSATGPIDLHWLALAIALAKAGLLTLDLECSVNFLISRGYDLPVIVNYQRCLIQELPITYENKGERLIARSARLLHIPST